MKYLAIIPLFALVLAGAGCTTRVDTDVEPTSVNPEPSTIEVESNSNTPSGEILEVDLTVDEEGNVQVIRKDEEPAPAENEPAPPEETEQANVLEINMDSGNFFFTPDTIEASPGQTVRVTFASNEGFHTFVIDELGLNKTVKAGSTLEFVAPSEPGSYAYYCDIGNHRAEGMEGVLTVK